MIRRKGREKEKKVNKGEGKREWKSGVEKNILLRDTSSGDELEDELEEEMKGTGDKEGRMLGKKREDEER